MLALFILGSTFFSREIAAQVRSGGAFLKVLPGVRNHGLAGSYTGVIDEIYALYANPAAAGFLREWQWATSYTEWIADTYSLSWIYGKGIPTPWSRRTRFAFGIHYQGVRSFNSTADPNAAEVSANDALLSLSVGNPLNMISENLSFGTNVKFFRSQLASISATSWMFDFGLLYQSNRFRVNFLNFEYGIVSAGVSLNQLGQPLNFISMDTPLPQTLRAGAALNIGSHRGFQLQLTGDYHKVRDEIGRVSLGAELSWSYLLGIRGGYHFNDYLFSNLSFGFSYRWGDTRPLPGKKNAMRLDFAYLEGNEFFSPPLRGGLNHYPIGPEKFDLLENPYAEKYAPGDTIPLSWENTRDPDLYDDIRYVLLLAKDNGLALQELREKTAKDPDFLLLLNDETNPGENIFETFDRQGDSAAPGKGGLPATGKISYQYPHDAAAADSAQAHDFTWITAFRQNESLPQPHHLLVADSLHEPGNYFWTVLAYDRDRHPRFAETIGHFEVDSIQPFKDERKIFPPPLVLKDVYDLQLSASVVIKPYRPDINFEFNKSTLTAAARRELDILAAALKSPELQNVFVKLGGHTDQVGNATYNKTLSAARVKSVERHLVEANRLEAERVFAHGYGEEYPLKDAALFPPAERKAIHTANRRVEIYLLKQADRDTTNQPIHQTMKINAVFHGDVISYRLNIENKGPGVARNFTVSDSIAKFMQSLPDSFRSSLLPGSASIGEQSLAWQFNELPPGETLRIQYALRVQEAIPANPYKWVNRGAVVSPDDNNPANNSAADTVYIIGDPAAQPFLAQSVEKKHVVQCGEFLSLLARVYYGDARKYRDIFNANKNVIGENPDKIYPGQQLLIPGQVNEMTPEILASAAFVNISGEAVAGNTLTGSYRYRQENRERDVPLNVTYQWLRNGTPIPGANCRTYTLEETDVDAIIKLEVKPLNAGEAFRGITASTSVGPVKARGAPPVAE